MPTPCLTGPVFSLRWWRRLAPWILALGLASGQAQTVMVSFDSFDADLTGGAPTPIRAELVRPAGEGPHPAVVLLHGCGGLYRSSGPHAGELVPRHADWAARLSAAGYVVLLPDSFGPRGVREICTLKDRPVRSSRERPRDAYGALRWLQQQPFVAPDRIALMGWSNGGGTVLQSISRGFAARPPLPQGDFRAAIAFYPGCGDPQRRAAAGRWRPSVPLLILQGEADDWTPAAPCRHLAEAAAERGDPVTLQLYPGAYHDFDAPDLPIRVRKGLASAAGGQAHVGTDPDARADALARVPGFLDDHLNR